MYDRIRRLRESRKFTQTDLAKMLYISQITYSRYERGVLNIPVVSLIKLADIYDTSIDFLVGLTDETKPYKRRGAGTIA